MGLEQMEVDHQEDREGSVLRELWLCMRMPVRSSTPTLLPMVAFPEGLAGSLSSSDSAESSRQTAGSVMVVDQASISNAIAASLGGITTSNAIAAMSSNSVRRRARSRTLAASDAGGARRMCRRMH